VGENREVVEDSGLLRDVAELFEESERALPEDGAVGIARLEIREVEVLVRLREGIAGVGLLG
jgi:hypothetical protein